MIVLMWVTRIAVLIHFGLGFNGPYIFFFFFCLFWVQGRRMLSHHRLFHDDDAQHTQMEWNGGRFPIDICILLALFYYYRRGKKRSNYGERKKLFFFFLLDEWTPIAVLFSIQQLISSLVNVCQLIHTHSNGFTPIIIDRPSRVLDNSIALIPVSSFFTWNFFVVFIFLVFFVLTMTFFFLTRQMLGFIFTPCPTGGWNFKTLLLSTRSFNLSWKPQKKKKLYIKNPSISFLFNFFFQTEIQMSRVRILTFPFHLTFSF